MPQTLKNLQLEIQVDLPHENYQSSRFDWTGKISRVNFQGIPISGVETHTPIPGHHYGQGFYNEFGMESLPGFEKTPIGGWCHKIGIGLVKKVETTYRFQQVHEIRPAAFEVWNTPNMIRIQCRGELVNGYAYLLEKEIEILEYGFEIRYKLINTGEKAFHTTEYNHNFLSTSSTNTSMDRLITFPFVLQPEVFDERVNPEQAIGLWKHGCLLKNSPDQQFFFSNLSGGKPVPAGWKYLDKNNHICIRETGSFSTEKVNLWGWRDVISPELFVEIYLEPGAIKAWTRTYDVTSTRI